MRFKHMRFNNIRFKSMRFRNNQSMFLPILRSALGRAFFVAILSFNAAAQAQMMGPGAGQGFMCPGFHSHGQLLRDPSVTLSVKDLHDGVAIEWTSTDPAKVVALRQMAAQMLREHEARAKVVGPPRNGRPSP